MDTPEQTHPPGTSAATTLQYASPSPLLQYGELLRDGPTLIVRDKSTLPQLCILCGRPADPTQKPLTLHFSWDPSFKVTHARSTLELRHSGTVHAFLCPAHLRSWTGGRRIGIIGMVTTGVLMFVATILAIFSEATGIPRYSPHALYALLVGFALFIIFLFLFALKTRTLSCIKIDQGYLHLAGVHESLLATLSSLPSR